MKKKSVSENTILHCIDSAMDGIQIVDGSGKVLYVNDNYLSMTKLTADIIGKNMRELRPQANCLKAIDQKCTLTKVFCEASGVEIISVSKPVFDVNGEVEYVVTNVRNISDYVNLNQSLLSINNSLSTSGEVKFSGNEIIAVDCASVRTVTLAERVSQVDTSVLLLGESGTGKDVMANFIHQCSRRKDKPFVALNCGAIPANLMEAELFGYTEGSFTGGAKGGKKGILHAAEGGTLFLDEIGDMPYSLQVKLLRVLENRVYTPIGCSKEVPIDIRFIAATNQDIQQKIRENKFRADLYYRLGVIEIEIPPLRQRRDDIVPLTLSFLKDINIRYGLNKKISTDVMVKLYQYDWPGNIRELRNRIERMAVLSDGEYLQYTEKVDELSVAGDASLIDGGDSLKDYMEQKEKEVLKAAKERCQTWRLVAERLQTDYSTIMRKVKRYHIE